MKMWTKKNMMRMITMEHAITGILDLDWVPRDRLELERGPRGPQDMPIGPQDSPRGPQEGGGGAEGETEVG